MFLEILNEEQGIVSISGVEDMGCAQQEEIKKKLPENTKLNDLVFFYMPDRDWIVINKSHALYEYYLQVLSCYLELSVEARKEIAVQAPTDTMKKALRILDGIIIRRALLYEGERKGSSMNKYPNLQELIKYHPYGENTACDHAGIEPELLQAAFKGDELLTPIEIISIAKLYRCPTSVIRCPKIIMFDMCRQKHKRMVRDVDFIYIQLKDMARGGNLEAEKYLKWADWKQQRFMRVAYEDRLSYGHYLGIKEQLEQYISFATPKLKRRGLTVMKGDAVPKAETGAMQGDPV